MASASSREELVLATASYDYTIRLWQAHKGTYLRHFVHPEFVSLSFSVSKITFQNILGENGEV